MVPAERREHVSHDAAGAACAVGWHRAGLIGQVADTPHGLSSIAGLILLHTVKRVASLHVHPRHSIVHAPRRAPERRRPARWCLWHAAAAVTAAATPVCLATPPLLLLAALEAAVWGVGGGAGAAPAACLSHCTSAPKVSAAVGAGANAIYHRAVRCAKSWCIGNVVRGDWRLLLLHLSSCGCRLRPRGHCCR